MKDILSIHEPGTPLPLVFDSPHSGDTYPADFKHACDPALLEATQDKYVDDLFASAPDYGATLLLAHFPRVYIDANRAVDDIDIGLIDEDWLYGDINPTARSDAGIGLIRRLVKPGIPVYDAPLSPEQIQSRIENYYHPYHSALCKIINDTHYNFGKVWHINCHSMPSSSATPKRARKMLGNKPQPSDFVLGNRDGTTCSLDFTHALRDFLKGKGHNVTINDPFKGVELIRTYSQPTRGRHSLQLEINKALYMDEKTGEKSKDYAAFKGVIEELIALCADYAQNQLIATAAD